VRPTRGLRSRMTSGCRRGAPSSRRGAPACKTTWPNSWTLPLCRSVSPPRSTPTTAWSPRRSGRFPPGTTSRRRTATILSGPVVPPRALAVRRAALTCAAQVPRRDALREIRSPRKPCPLPSGVGGSGRRTAARGRPAERGVGGASRREICHCLLALTRLWPALPDHCFRSDNFCLWMFAMSSRGVGVRECHVSENIPPWKLLLF
jgi:hypothetical protein